MPIPIYWKDPDDKADYGFDWTDVLSESTPADTISTSAWVVDDAGITVLSESNDPHTTTVWLEGGEAGHEYRVTNTITTAGDREFERSIIIVVADL